MIEFKMMYYANYIVCHVIEVVSLLNWRMRAYDRLLYPERFMAYVLEIQYIVAYSETLNDIIYSLELPGLMNEPYDELNITHISLRVCIVLRWYMI